MSKTYVVPKKIIEEAREARKGSRARIRSKEQHSERRVTFSARVREYRKEAAQ